MAFAREITTIPQVPITKEEYPEKGIHEQISPDLAHTAERSAHTDKAHSKPPLTEFVG